MDCLTIYNFNSYAILEPLTKLLKYSVASGRIFTGMFYIPIGMILSKKQSNLAISWSMLVGGILINTMISSVYLNSYLVAISSIGFFCIVNSFKLPDSKIYLVIRKMSTVIYLIHMYIWSFYYMLIYGKKTYGLDCFLVTMSISLIVAIVGAEIMNRKSKSNSKIIFRVMQ